MKKVVFAAAVLAAIVSATGTASAVSSSVFPITAQEGFIRIAPSDLPQAVRDALDKKYPGSFVEEAYFKGDNETYIEGPTGNDDIILYDNQMRDRPRTRRTKRNV